jgi:hypothetical protein
MFSIRMIVVIPPGCQVTLGDIFISGLFNDLGELEATFKGGSLAL